MRLAYGCLIIASAAAAAAIVGACASEAASAKAKKKTPIDYDDSSLFDDQLPERDPSVEPDITSSDAGTYTAERKADAGRRDAQAPDAARSGDAGRQMCPGPAGPGDLLITELMISSIKGAGDRGEWVEIRSTRNCWLNLLGVRIESPRGTDSDGFTFDTAFELPPQGSFIVAGSTEATTNGNLPGYVFSWNASDVLKNDGDTVRVLLGSAVLDAVTYPRISNLVPGRSAAFPIDCRPEERANWARWSFSFYGYYGTFIGTPNTDNDDVACY